MLINRNITVGGHRTSIRLEPEFWAGLADIAQHEHVTIDQLCTEVDRGAGDLSRTAAVRVFITSYMVRRAERAGAQQSRSFNAVGGNYSESQDVDSYPSTAHRYRAAG